MSEFLTELRVENASGLDDGKWRLTAPLVYQSDVAGMTFTAPAGMVTDFASVPRAPLAYMLFGDRASEAAVIHDYIYGSHVVPRAVADAVLREASAVTGVSWFSRNSMWLGVRLFGGSHWDSKPITA